MALQEFQTAHTLLAVEDPSNTYRVFGAAQSTLVVEDSAQKVPIGQVSFLVLITDAGLPPPTFVNGVTESALVVEVASVPTPAFVNATANLALITEQPNSRLFNAISTTLITDNDIRAAILQTKHMALVVQEAAIDNSAITQLYHTGLVVQEEARHGTILGQTFNASLLVTEEPSKAPYGNQVAHLALHLDINNSQTLIRMSSAFNATLIQEELPTPDPLRQRHHVMLNSINATVHYPQHVQSATFDSSVVSKVAVAKILPQHVQSNALASTLTESVATRSQRFVDPTTFGSFLYGSNVINAVAIQTVKDAPAGLQSDSKVLKLANMISRTVVKLNPVDVVSTEQTSLACMLSATVKAYPAPGGSSSSIQLGAVMVTSMRKVFPQHVQSKSIIKKMARLVGYEATYTDLGVIRSATIIPIVSQSTSIKVTYQVPSDIRPVLSLSGMSMVSAVKLELVDPSLLLSTSKMVANVMHCGIEKDYQQPDTILGDNVSSYATTIMVARRAQYGDPIDEVTVRRDVYGAYYTVLDN